MLVGTLGLLQNMKASLFPGHELPVCGTGEEVLHRARLRCTVTHLNLTQHVNSEASPSTIVSPWVRSFFIWLGPSLKPMA